MRVFTCNEFTGHYPVGTAAVITAFSKEQAKEWLEKKLKLENLEQIVSLDSIKEVELAFVGVQILCDGNY